MSNIICYRCPAILTGGVDTFGPPDAPVCAACYLTGVEEWVDACLDTESGPDYAAEHRAKLAEIAYLVNRLRRANRHSTQWRRLKRKLKSARFEEEGLYWSAKFCAAGPRSREGHSQRMDQGARA